MIRPGSDADRVCVAKANEAGQGHIFGNWDALSSEDQRALMAQVEGLDFQLLKRLVQEHLSAASEAGARVLKPAPTLGWWQLGREEMGLCRTLGEYAIRQGEVALVTAAADGGTFPEPTGLVPVGPVSGKCLLQLHAERIQAVNRRYKVSLRWFIFCHPAERERLSAHFKANGHFGLKCSDITFIDQDLLPVVDRRGKILLSAPGRIAMSPNGHGGILTQCLEGERLDLLERAGIRYLYYFQVDNALARVPDPLFLGHHIKNQAEVSTKAVHRIHPDERVGVICVVNGVLGVVEHTHMDAADRAARAEDGDLLLRSANTGMHVFSLDFLRRLRSEGFQLSYRPVERVTPYLGKSGKVVRPSKPNSLRFKTFIFDAIRKTERANIIEVERSEEFSPVKNVSGSDSPETARRDLSRLHASWLRAAQADLPEKTPLVEISPLYALDLDELREKLEVPVGAGAPHNGWRPQAGGDGSFPGAGGNILLGR